MDRSALLNRLWEIQDADRYISDKKIAELAAEYQLSEIEVEGVVSFYHFFHQKPAGKFTIYLTDSVLSEIRGYASIKAAFEEATGERWNSAGGATGMFGLYDTSCIGWSDAEPAALINFVPFVNLTPGRVWEIIAGIRAGKSLEYLSNLPSDPIYPVLSKADSVFFKPYEMGQTLRRWKGRSPEEVLGDIEKARLSGMGGAFFPTALKWATARKSPGEQKYVICNADEGEPGTFKDRVLLRQLPGLVFEGMIACGHAIGATQGILYLRAEYRFMKPDLERVLDEFREAGWLGDHFDIRIQLGAGAYVCGEETALIESLEGKRGEPRIKTYFPAQRGYMNMPTVVNNVETFAAAARILEYGPDWFLQKGSEQSKGTKLLSVAGDCERPGIYEVEWGTTVRQVIEHCGASEASFIQFSGPAGTMIGREELDRTISREDIPCNGSFTIFNHDRDLLAILANNNRFFQRESCGVCTPCRAGNFIIGRQIDRLRHSLARPQDMDAVRQWSALMRAACRCGLGQTAPNVLLAALDRFPERIAPFLQERDDMAFDLDQATRAYDDFSSKYPYGEQPLHHG